MFREETSLSSKIKGHREESEWTVFAKFSPIYYTELTFVFYHLFPQLFTKPKQKNTFNHFFRSSFPYEISHVT